MGDLQSKIENRKSRIPYDALTLSALTWELQRFVGGKVQGVHQPDDFTVGVGLYSKLAGAGMLLISCHPQYARAYLTTKRMQNAQQPPTFCATLRARLDGGFLRAVAQIGFDRILELDIEHPEGAYRVIAELMGKHSNIMLVDQEKKVISAAKWIGRSKSSRPIQPGGKYHPPPVARDSNPWIDGPPSAAEALGPFLRKLIEADPVAMEKARAVVLDGKVEPVLSPGHGAYPISVAALGLKEFRRDSMSIALEQHWDVYIPEQEGEALKRSLLGQIDRVIFAREVALKDLRQAEDTANRAAELQRTADLILAYGPQSAQGASSLEAYDFDGQPITIQLNPELTWKENANAFFEKAKKAKGRMGQVQDQISRLAADKADLESFRFRLEAASRVEEVRALEDEAKKHRWLHAQTAAAVAKEDRPFAGHRVRELLGPNGYTIYYGENAEANDYLVLRVAKPNDWWLHVRGHVSGHVVIATRNEPDKVPKQVIEYAAKIAVQHSQLKHSGYVPVDYTLRKYVRKPKGAAKGTAFYTHEKTLHIES